MNEVILATYSVLIINDNLPEAEQIETMLSQSRKCRFLSEKVTDFYRAKIINSYKNYDAYLISDSLSEYMEWVYKVSSQPVILLTNNQEEGINNLDKGISDYILRRELSSFLLETSLRLSITNASLKKNLQKTRNDFQTKVIENNQQKQNLSEQLLHSIFENSDDGILIVDKDGFIRFINPMGIKLLNKSFSELIGSHFGIPLVDKSATQIEVIDAQGKISVLEMSIGETKWNQNLAWIIIIRDITKEVESNRALSQAKKLYQELYQKTPAMLHSIDLKGEIVSVSNLWLEILGYTEEEVIGKQSTDFLTAKSKKYAQEIVLPYFFKVGHIRDVEYQFVKKNGEIIDVLLSATSESDEKGDIIRTLAVLTNITDKKKAEKELEEYHKNLEKGQENLKKLVAIKNKELAESEQILRELTENIASVFWLGKVDTQEIIHVSPAYERIWGNSCDSLYENPLSWLNLVHPEDKDLVLNNLIEQKKEKYTDIEYRIIDQNNSIRWISTSTFLIFDEKGKPEKIAGISNDITNKKNYQIRLQESEYRYATLVDLVPIGIFRSDIKGNIIYVNKKGLQIINATFDEVKDTRWKNFIYPEDLPKVWDSWFSCVANKSRFSSEHRFIDRYKNVKWMLVEAIPESNSQGEITGYIGYLIDINHRKEAEIKIKKSEELYRLTLDSISDAVFMTDNQGNFTFIYPNAKTILGYTSESVSKMKHIYELLGEHWSNLSLFTKFSEVKNLEVEIKDDNDHSYFVLINIKRVTIDNGTILITCHDITERVKIQNQLIKAKEKYQIILEKTFEGFWIIDVDKNPGKILEVNDSYCRMTGYSRKELLQMSIFDLEIIKDRTQINNRIEKVISLGNIRFETQHLTKDKQVIDFSVSVNYIRELNCLFSFFNDITEAKKSLQALRQSEYNYSVLAKTIPVGLFRNDIDHNCVYINQKCSEIIGISPEKCIEREWINCIYPEDRKKVSQAWLDFLEDKNDFHLEYRFVHKNGEIVWVYAQTVWELNEKGDRIGSLGTLTDISDRKKIEIALQESQNSYSNLAKVIPVGLYRNDINHNCIYINDKCAEIVGISKEKCVQQEWLKYIHPDDSEKVWRKWLGFLAHKHDFHIEYRFLHEDGEILWVYTQAIWETNDKGEIIGTIGTITDITQLKKIEIALQKSEASLKFAQQIAHLGNWDWDIDENTIFWSDEHYRIMGLEPREITPSYEKFMSFVHPEDEELVKQAIYESLSQGKKYEISHRIKLADGNVRFVSGQGEVILDENQKAVKMLGTIQDVTKQKKAEDALKESEESFRKIFRNAPIGIYITDLDGNFVKVNKKLCEFLNYQESELLKLNIKQIIYAHDLPKSLKLAKKVLSGKMEKFSLDKRYLTRKNEKKWASVICTLIKDLNNNPKYFISIIDDLQERKDNQITLIKAKQQAEAASLAKSQFLANMTHELRTPLNAILGFSQLISKSPEVSFKNKENLQIINRSGQHLLSLINDILDLSKIQANKIELKIEAFDFYSFLNSVEEIFVLKAINKNLKLVFIKSHDVPQYIKADKSKLKSILINLIGNAIKFTNKGNIQVQIKRKTLVDKNNKLNLAITIKDTGTGIDKEDISKIFDPFEQTKNAKNSGQGSGLGLAITKNYIELMGGKIDVKSEVNIGSTFSFNIICELANQNEVLFIPNQGSIVGLQNNQPSYRILIIEDKENNRKLLKSLLEYVGFEQIKEAVDGKEGFELWQIWQPHLILMDVNMPIMNGHQTTNKIRVQQSKTDHKSPVKIIALSTNMSSSQAKKLIKLGYDDVVSKPIQEDELWTKIGKSLQVSYVYESSSNLDLKTKHAYYNNLKREDLLIMSPEWRDKLYKACLAARKSKIVELIKKIPPENLLIINSLNYMLEQLNFEGIINLIE